MARKGQFFIIAAIIITLSLLMIKSLLGLYSSEEIISSESMKLSDRQLENIRNEYEYAAGIAATMPNPNASATAYLSNFSDFIRYDKNFRALWVSIAVNGTNQNYYATAGNYLQVPVSITISVTNSTTTSTVLNISDRAVGSYSFASQINGSINMTIRYMFEDYQNEDIVKFEVSERNSTTLFLDIMLKDGDTRIREKSVYSATIL